MINFLSFNYFKTRTFKIVILSLALVTASGLMVVINYQGSNNTVNVSDSNKLSGFHITIKENNKNLVSEANTWNLINNNYEEFVTNQKEKLITTEFKDWSDIINQINIKPNEDPLSKDVNNTFINQIKENHILPDNSSKYFTNNIIGRSVAKKSLNDVDSFGDVYVGYHDNSLPSQINNGFFATINPKADFNNYFSIPYIIKPSDQFFKTHNSIYDRVAILPLNNSKPNDINQPMLAILVKKSASDIEQLLINGSYDNVFQSGKLVSYALLNHDPNSNFNPTTFHINVKNSGYQKTVALTNNSSNMQFSINDKKNRTNDKVTQQYLVQNNRQNNTSTLIVMNEVAENVKVNFKNPQQNWKIWDIDSKTLQKTDGGKAIKDGKILSIDPISNFQIYCIGLDLQNDLEQQAASEQYITVYKTNTELPNFKNCTNFFQENNDLFKGFQQYLSASTNNSIKVEDLKNNAGEFLSWFIQYQGVITKQNYVNYLQSNEPEKHPWNVNLSLSTKTLVDHWNVLIIAGFIFSLLIIMPVVVIVIRKKKYLK